MKRTLLLIALVTGFLAKAGAQDLKVVPAYWVVETNVRQKNFSIVRLYDEQNNLVHEVKMDGLYFDVNKPRHRKKLDLLLKGSYPLVAKKSTPDEPPADSLRYAAKGNRIFFMARSTVD